jgi:hypothetical protein
MANMKYATPFRGGIGSPWCDADKEPPIYNCPVQIEWQDKETRRLKQQFIADARGYTPAQAAAKAAMIANCLAAYLNSYTTNGRLRYDAFAFAELFELPTDLSVAAKVPPVIAPENERP